MFYPAAGTLSLQDKHGVTMEIGKRHLFQIAREGTGVDQKLTSQ
jgi:hypothetical protein